MKPLLLTLVILPLFSFTQKNNPKMVDINKAALKILQVGAKPDFIATDGDNAWVIDDHQNRIIKISANAKTVLLTVAVSEACTAPVIGFNAVWVMSCSEKKLYRIDHTTGKILAKIETGIADTNGEMSLAIGDGSVWVLTDSSGVLSRINPQKNTIEKKIKVKPHSYCAAFGYGAVWITNYAANSIQKINTQTNTVTATIPVGKHPRFLTVGEQSIWTLNQGDGTVSRIDPVTDKRTATINTKATGGGGDISCGSGKVWVVSTHPDRPVQVINASSNTIETIYTECAAADKTCKVDGAVRLSEHFVWISGYYSKRIWLLKK